MTAQEGDWSGTTWEDAERNTLLAGSTLSFREKLLWLEEAARFTNVLRHARVRYPDDVNPGQWIIAEHNGFPYE